MINSIKAIAGFTHISLYPEMITERTTSAVSKNDENQQHNFYFPNKNKDIQNTFI